MNFEFWGGRKFLLCVGGGIVSSVLVWFGKVSGVEYVSLIGFTIGAYITGGTIDNIKNVNNLNKDE